MYFRNIIEEYEQIKKQLDFYSMIEIEDKELKNKKEELLKNLLDKYNCLYNFANDSVIKIFISTNMTDEIINEMCLGMNSLDVEFKELYDRLPEVLRNALAACEQDPIYHPEGVVSTHVEQVFEYAKEHFPEDVDLQVCALFHDLGKPETQTIKINYRSSFVA